MIQPYWYLSLMVPLFSGPFGTDETWISAHGQGSVGQDESVRDGPRPSSSSWYWKNHSSPLKTPLTPEFISSLFSNVPSFQNSEIRKFKKIIFYKLRKLKTSKNSKSSNLAKSKWFVVRIDNWNFSVRVHDSNHSHFITLESNYKHLKSILNSEQFQV